MRVRTRGYLLPATSAAAASASGGTTTTARGAAGAGADARALPRPPAMPAGRWPASDSSAAGSTAVGDGGVNDDVDDDGDASDKGNGGGDDEDDGGNDDDDGGDDDAGSRGWGGDGGDGVSWPASHPQRRRCTHDRGASKGDFGWRWGRLHSRMPISMTPGRAKGQVKGRGGAREAPRRKRTKTWHAHGRGAGAWPVPKATGSAGKTERATTTRSGEERWRAPRAASGVERREEGTRSRHGKAAGGLLVVGGGEAGEVLDAGAGTLLVEGGVREREGA